MTRKPQPVARYYTYRRPPLNAKVVGTSVEEKPPGWHRRFVTAVVNGRSRQYRCTTSPRGTEVWAVLCKPLPSKPTLNGTRRVQVPTVTIVEGTKDVPGQLTFEDLE